MEAKFDKLKMELKELIRQGDLLYYSMVNEQGQLSPELVKMFQEKDIEFPNFITEYDIWYS